MKKIYYNKLIRDRIPEVIKENGSDCEVRKLKAKEFDEKLLKKVDEEVSEFLGAKSRKEIVAELADVLDVLEEIKKRKKITSQEIQQAQKQAFKKKGGFKKRLFLIWSSDSGYKTNEQRSA